MRTIISAAPQQVSTYASSAAGTLSAPLVLSATCTIIASGAGGYVRASQAGQTIINRAGGSLNILPPPGKTLEGGAVDAAAILENGQNTIIVSSDNNAFFATK